MKKVNPYIVTVCVAALILVVVFGLLLVEVYTEVTEPSCGIICELKFREAHTEVRTHTTVINGNVHTSMIPVYVPDQYIVVYENENEDGEKKIGDALTDAVTYNKLRVGDWWGECDDD